MLKWFLLFLFLTSGIWADDAKWVKEPVLTFDAKEKNWIVSFETNQPADVEVTIVDAVNKNVIRHLVAGVMGKNPPMPLVPNSNSQNILWDGKDDFGNLIKESSKPFARVRIGMKVVLKNIVGGDPYSFYSKDMGQGDHAHWQITGLEAKSDGKVYVMGNSTYFGPPTIRQYDGNGNFLRTVFPFPSGMPVEKVKDWGVYIKSDGTYAPKYNDDMSAPALTTTIINKERGGCAGILPSPDNNTLNLAMGTNQMTIGIDGSLVDYKANPIILSPKMNPYEIMGSFFTAYTCDKKYFYVSGIFSKPASSKEEIDKTGFWRDGQIWKVDVATRIATSFFAIPEDKVISSIKERGLSPIGHVSANPYAAFHGIAVDKADNVFVCDRQNQRIVVLDKEGKVIREISLPNPDAIVLNPNSKEIYVTTYYGNYHKMGELKIVKFKDWSKDTTPSIVLPLCKVGVYPQVSHLAISQTNEGVNLWVAYTELPVHVYKDKGDSLELIKDFYSAGQQKALDLQHMIVDQKTNDVYISDGWGCCFKINDWSAPKFKQCMIDEKTPLSALSLGIDVCNRRIYGHADRKAAMRYKMDGEFYAIDSAGNDKKMGITPLLTNDWRIGLGFGERGIAAASDGSLVTLAEFGTGPNYSGIVNYFSPDETKAPWPSLSFDKFGKARLGGVKFDLQGNLYVGRYDDKPQNVPVGFEKDSNFNGTMGKIYKFAPTRNANSGNIFTTEPVNPQKIYDINYGSIAPSFTRTPRFGVDGFGQIYYPTSLSNQVSVIDNEGNKILNFGTYGNRDSMGGLKGDLISTKDIPLAWPNSVDASDDFIYVSDIVNIRVLQLEKKFVLTGFSK